MAFCSQCLGLPSCKHCNSLPFSSVLRHAASQRPLVPFDPLYRHEVNPNGDLSGGGLASQDSTMERHKAGKQRGAGGHFALGCPFLLAPARCSIS